jgi:hypothetical protein
VSALVSLAGVRWYAPHVPGKGWPIVRDPKPPMERACVAAYSTREACAAALKLYPEAAIEIREVDASAFVAERAARGLVVIVDLVLDGAASSYLTYHQASPASPFHFRARAALSPEGEA